MAIDWEGLKRDYEKKGFPVSRLAEKYKCHPVTIRRRLKREGWKKADRKKASGRVCSAAPEKNPDKRIDIADDHRIIWKGVKKRLVRGLKSSDLKLGLEELKVAKLAGEVLTSVIKGELQAWGLDDKGGEKAPDDTEEITRQMASLTVSSGTDEALDGE